MRRQNFASKSSQNLEKELSRAKGEKKTVLNQLKVQLKESNNFIKSMSKVKEVPRAKISEEDALIGKINKQKSMAHLSKNLSDRMKKDKQVKAKLSDLTQDQKSRQAKIEKRIIQVQRRNEERMKELEKYEKRYLQKITQQYNKDKLKEQRLVEEYQKALQKQGKIRYAKDYRQAVETEDWRVIIEEKRKLKKMVENFMKKQDILIQDQLTNKKDKQPVDQKQKQDPLKQPQQPVIVQGSDAKEIGNQYLQFAKKMQAQKNEKPKPRLMNVNLKSIDYSKEIMKKIARNTGDLSRLAPPSQSPQGTIRQTKTKDLKQNEQNKEQKREPIIQLIKDEETERYLQQIKKGVAELQKSAS